MTKPRKGAMAWLADVFSTSHKAISENLSAEEYSQFVDDASKLQASEGSDEEEEETEEEETEEENDDNSGDADGDGKNTDPKNADPGKGNKSFEARLSALEGSLKNSQAALKTENRTNATLKSKVSDLEGKLKASEEQKTKLRNAVNQLGDEDLSDSETSEEHLTQADIEARESYQRRNPKK